MSQARYQQLQKEFNTLFFKKMKKKEVKNMLPNDQIALLRIIYVVNMEILKDWAQKIVVVYHEDQEKKKEKMKGMKNFFGGFGGLFGKKPDPKEEKKKEEAKKEEAKEDQESLEKLLSGMEDQSLYSDHFTNSADHIKLKLDFSLQEASLILEIEKNQEEYKQSEGVRLWSGNTKINATLLQNKSLDLELFTSDFGLDLYSVEKTSRLKDSVIYKQSEAIQNIFEVRFKQNPQKEIDLSVTLYPIVLVFQQLLFQRLVSFFKISSLFNNEAYNQLRSIQASSQVIAPTDSFYEKNHRLFLKVLSPTLLVPFQRNNDFNSPTWSFNLGDISATNISDLMSMGDRLDGNKYDAFNLSIERLGLQFFYTMKAAREFNRKKSLNSSEKFDFLRLPAVRQTTGLRQTHGFDVISPLSLTLLIGIRKKKVKDLKQPKIRVSGSLTDVSIKVTPQLYNDLVNIDNCFMIDKTEQWEQLLHSKNQIIKLSRKISQLKRRNQFRTWTSTFAVLSGGYIYFYDRQKEVQVSSYFFLKDAQIQKKQIGSGVDAFFVLELKNGFGDECSLSFTAKDQRLVWEDLIIQQVIEMSPSKNRRHRSLQDKEKKILKEDLERKKEESKLVFAFKAPLVNFNLLDANYEEWMKFQLRDFEYSLRARELDFEMDLSLFEVNLLDHKNFRYQHILYSESGRGKRHHAKPILELKLNQHSKNAENYEDVDFQLELNIGSLRSNFNPPTVHQLLVYLANIEPNKLRYHRSQQQDPNFEELVVNRNILEEIKKIKKDQNLPQNEPFSSTFEVKVGIKEVILLALNPLYNTPFIQIEMGESLFEYYRRRDHEVIVGKLGNVLLIDKTNWPQTLDPQKKEKLSPAPWSFDSDEDDKISEESENENVNDSEEEHLEENDDQQLELFGPRDIEGHTDPDCVLEFRLKIMKSICPDKEPGIKNICTVQLNAFQVVYFQEMVFRIMDYFFDQFLEALSTKPDSDKKKDVEREMTLQEQELLDKLLDLSTGYKEVFDLQRDERTRVTVIVDRPLIILKPRPSSKEWIEFDLGKIKIQNGFEAVQGRWINAPEQKILTSKFLIEAQQMFIKWSEQPEPMSEPFNLVLHYQKVAWQQFIANNIPHTILDQSSRFEISLSPILVNIEQTQFTFLMKCLDLNINYEDCLKDRYQFALIKPVDVIHPHQVKMRVFMDCSSFTLKLFKRKLPTQDEIMISYESPAQSVAQLSLIGIDLKFIKEMGGKADITADLRTIFVLFEEKTIPVTARQLQTHSQQGPVRRILCGPLKSPLYVRTNQSFYKSLETSKKQISFHLVREANGDKIVQATVHKMKIFLMPHIFYSLFEFFVYGLPTYSVDSIDKPNQFEPDLEKSPKMIVNTNISHSLVCANQEIAPNSKTIAFEGDIIFYYMRETVKRIKEVLKEQRKQINRVEELSQIMSQIKLHALNLSCFVCKMNDLNGKSFKQVKKRRIVHPFPVFFNSKEMLCLTQEGRFKAYNKKEVDLETTIIKLSYMDFATLYRIVFYNLNLMQIQMQGEIVEHYDDSQQFTGRQSHFDEWASRGGHNDSSLKIQLDTLEKARSMFSKMKDNYEKRAEIFKPPPLPHHLYKASGRSMTRRGGFSSQTIIEQDPQDNENVSDQDLHATPVRTRTHRSMLSVDKDVEASKQQTFTSMMKRRGTDATTITFGPNRMSILLGREEAENIVRMHKPRRTTKVQPKKQKMEFERLPNQFELVTHKLQLIIINDHDNEFCPVLEFNFSEFQYVYHADAGSSTKLSFQSYYYNPQYSIWEPFIENMLLEFHMAQIKDRRSIQLRSLQNFNINISEMLCDNLINAKLSWERTYSTFKTELELQSAYSSPKRHKDNYDSSASLMRFIRQPSEEHDFRSLSGFSPDFQKGNAGKTHHAALYFEELPGHSLQPNPSRHDLDGKMKEDTVSPYTIENYSGFRIFVQKMIGEKQEKKEGMLSIGKYIVESGDSLQIEIDYEQRIAGQLWRDEYDPLSKSDNEDSVRIVIADPEQNYEPIERVSFGSVGFFTHNLKTGRSFIPFGVYEFLIYEVTLSKMRKIITLRTPYMFFNKTAYTYLVRFSRNPQPASFTVRRMRPGQVLPVPIRDISCFLSIAIEDQNAEQELVPSKTGWRNISLSTTSVQSEVYREVEWSHEFQMGQFANVRNEAYLSLQHGKRYSYINKQVQHSKAVDFLIMAPILIYNALPCPLDICITKENNAIYTLKTGQQKYINSFSFGEKIPLLFQLEGFEWCHHIIKAHEKPKAGEDIRIKLKQIKDPFNIEKEGGRSLNLYLRVLSGEAGKRFVVYARSILLNKTDQPLSFFYTTKTKNKLRSVAGQQSDSRQNIILLSDKDKLRASLGGNFSETFSIAATGMQGEFGIKCAEKNHTRFFEFSFKSSQSLAVEGEQIYSKIVTVAPKYVVINAINAPIQLVQADYFHYVDELMPYERRPFYWYSRKHQKLIRAREVDQNDQEDVKGEDDKWDQEWAFSNPFPPQDIGTTAVTNRHTIFRNAARYMRIDRRHIDQTIYIVLDRESELHPVFRFENYCLDVSILYKQSGVESCDHLGARKSVNYAWQDLTQQNPTLQVCFLLGDVEEHPVFIDGSRIELDLSALDQIHEILIPTNVFQHFVKIFVSITTDGHTRVVRFYQPDEGSVVESEKEQNIQKIESSLDIQFREIGVSFVMKNAQQRNIELTYLSLSDIQAMMLNTPHSLRTLQLRVGYMQIDNMSLLKTIYPVVLRPKFMEKLPPGKAYNKPFLDVSLDINLKNDNVLHFAKIQAFLQTLTLRVENDFLNLSFDFWSRLFKKLNSSLTKVNPLFERILVSTPSKSINTPKVPALEGDAEKRSTDFAPWRTIDALSPSKMIYIGALGVSSLDLQISFTTRSAVSKHEKQALNSFSEAFGVSLKNFQNAAIKLNHIRSFNVFGSSNDILQQIFELYKDRLLRNVLYIIGSIDLLGNPINVFNTLGTGVKDFFLKPAEGFSKGPLGAGKGIIQGTGSLMKHSVQGAFGMSSKIASSMSKGLLTLMNDEEFINSEERKESQPRHVIDGVSQGLKNAFTSIRSGIIGVVAEPVNGVKRKGTKGFFTGALKGLAGVVVKPLSGGFDLVHKTSEGIKNTAGYLDKERVDRRIRHPRCFYGEGDIIRLYEENDSLVLVFLDRVKKGAFLNDHFLEAYLFEAKSTLFMLLMSVENVVLIDTTPVTIVWEVRSSRIAFVEKGQSLLKLFLKMKEGSPSSQEIAPAIQDNVTVNYLYSRLSSLATEDP